MKTEIKTLAGIVVCALGSLVFSSCSKDEFFGLEDAEVLDYSTKYEIAMSQEYVDYVIACYNMVEIMNQPVDTTQMEVCGVINGKRVYAKTDSCASALDLLESLKKAYPILLKADKIDIDEIRAIALEKNETLKEMSSKKASFTKVSPFKSFRWAESLGHYGCSFIEEGWWFNLFAEVHDAVNDIIWSTSEGGFLMGGGLIFSDYTAVSMTGIGLWPSVVNSGTPRANADFIVAPTNEPYINWGELWDFGPEYSEGVRLHYVYGRGSGFETYFYY